MGACLGCWFIEEDDDDVDLVWVLFELVCWVEEEEVAATKSNNGS